MREERIVPVVVGKLEAEHAADSRREAGGLGNKGEESGSQGGWVRGLGKVEVGGEGAGLGRGEDGGGCVGQERGEFCGQLTVDGKREMGECALDDHEAGGILGSL